MQPARNRLAYWFWVSSIHLAQRFRETVGWVCIMLGHQLRSEFEEGFRGWGHACWRWHCGDCEEVGGRGSRCEECDEVYVLVMEGLGAGLRKVLQTGPLSLRDAAYRALWALPNECGEVKQLSCRCTPVALQVCGNKCSEDSTQIVPLYLPLPKYFFRQRQVGHRNFNVSSFSSTLVHAWQVTRIHPHTYHPASRQLAFLGKHPPPPNIHQHQTSTNTKHPSRLPFVFSNPTSFPHSVTRLQ